jgi:methyl-accepting chemotaxis protein
MKAFGNLSIRYKILSITLAAVAGFMVYLLFNYHSNTENAARLQRIEAVQYPILAMASNNRVLQDTVKQSFNAAVSSGEAELIESAVEAYSKLKANYAKQRELDATDARSLDVLTKLSNEYFSASLTLSQGMLDGSLPFDQMAVYVDAIKNSLEPLEQQLADYEQHRLAVFSASLKEAKLQSDNVVKVGLIVALVSVLVTALVSWLISHIIVVQIDNVANSLKAIAEGEGDLTQRIELSSTDEVGTLVHWFNQFLDKLHLSISQIVNTFEPLSGVTTELDQVTRQSAELADIQNSNSEQASQAMDDMVHSVREIAQNASSASNAAVSADEEAKSGLGVVDGSVESINALAEQVEHASGVISQLETFTGDVGAILDVIRGIAEQTNLLALNAAIEAARAGEQGRGFAVVADEVRTLASRTQDSTQEIQSVIEQLQASAQSAVTVMDQGKSLAGDSVEKAAVTGETLRTITGKVEDISDMNMQIATATEEQERVTETIRNNVSMIRDSSEQGVQNTESIAKASQQLVDIADQLRSVGSQFKV